jgi:hypothetical protein
VIKHSVTINGRLYVSAGRIITNLPRSIVIKCCKKDKDFTKKVVSLTWDDELSLCLSSILNTEELKECINTIKSKTTHRNKQRINMLTEELTKRNII